jgi:hypothetical protein
MPNTTDLQVYLMNTLTTIDEVIGNVRKDHSKEFEQFKQAIKNYDKDCVKEAILAGIDINEPIIFYDFCGKKHDPDFMHIPIACNAIELVLDKVFCAIDHLKGLRFMKNPEALRDSLEKEFQRREDFAEFLIEHGANSFRQRKIYICETHKISSFFTDFTDICYKSLFKLIKKILIHNTIPHEIITDTGNHEYPILKAIRIISNNYLEEKAETEILQTEVAHLLFTIGRTQGITIGEFSECIDTNKLNTPFNKAIVAELTIYKSEIMKTIIDSDTIVVKPLVQMIVNMC